MNRTTSINDESDDICLPNKRKVTFHQEQNVCSIQEEKNARKSSRKVTIQKSMLDMQSEDAQSQQSKRTKKYIQNSSQKAFKRTQLNFRNIVRKQNVSNIIQNFRNKIKRNNIMLPPVQFTLIGDNSEKQEQKKLEGVSFSNHVQILIRLLIVARFLFVLVLYGLALVFDGVIERSKMFGVFLELNLILQVAQLLYGGTCQKIVGDKRLSQISQILRYYVKHELAIDTVVLVVLAIDLGSNWQGMRFIRLLFFLKSRDFFRKVSELQNFFITNFEREQYWGVVKVFLINFLMAHLIGIILISIASGNQNWMSTMGISYLPWNQQYAYAYFWAMSTMLGFGNATPSNPQEAVLISVIQCVSCILFAYIINEVGTLLTNITKKNQTKQKNLQTSRRLAEENQISEDLLSKINNYIRQTDSIEKKYNFQLDRQFIGGLPADLKGEFLKESNRRIFRGLAFFKNLSERTLMDLAQHINIKIAHPQEVIFQRKQPFKFLILKKGKIGFFAQGVGNSSFKDIPINSIKVDDHKNASLLSLSIFQKDYRASYYQIKALDISVVYYLTFEETCNVVKKSASQYEKLCELKDRSDHFIDEFEILKCDYCETNHSKMRCPRLHFMPLKSLVIQKALKRNRFGTNGRKSFSRGKREIVLNPLILYKQVFRIMELSVFPARNKEEQFMSIYENFVTGLISKKLINEEDAGTFRLKKTYRQEDLKNAEALHMLSHLSNLKSQNQVRKMFSEIKDNIEDLVKINTVQSESFWELQIDLLNDYRFYFPSSNPSELKNFTFKVKKHKIARSQCMNLNELVNTMIKSKRSFRTRLF